MKRLIRLVLAFALLLASVPAIVDCPSIGGLALADPINYPSPPVPPLPPPGPEGPPPG